MAKRQPPKPRPRKGETAKKRPPRKRDTTRVVVNVDVGLSNYLHIRGSGAHLSWEEGIEMTNTKPDEWIWETTAQFDACEFKILLNDQQYEVGDNHQINHGSNLRFTPRF